MSRVRFADERQVRLYTTLRRRSLWSPNAQKLLIDALAFETATRRQR